MTISSATPNINAHTINIAGSGFGSAMPIVTLAAMPLTVVAWSDTSIDAIIPDVAPGGYNVVVARIEKGKIVVTGSIDVAIGAAGSKGPTGDRGDTGQPGLQGEPGPEGPQGPPGARGATGPQGARGETGAAGTTGVTGDRGPQGIQGDAGAQGPRGAAGPPGIAGPIGPAGPQGASLAFGTIVGRAIDCAANPAPGARAAIAGTSFDAAASSDGQFMLLHVPPGTYTVRVETASRSGIIVSDRATIDVGDISVCPGS